ncbi:Wzy polymerase domain-containing protein [Photobacterium sp. MCCC 1A19761]|uniref:PglL family O-oligosaccharyltransferase n=1 Tax=Photobacterium sp. MCCC 1A19761 TaxID=3115000 RepID=UPI00307EEC91
MNLLHVQGTRLAQQRISKPVIKPFMATLSVLFLFTMHYFQHNPGGSGLALSFNAASWIPLSFAIAFGLFEICRQKTWRYSRLTLILFACCVLLTLPVLYPNAGDSTAAGRLLGLWAGFLFFLALQQFAFSHKQRQHLLWLILAAVWLQALLGWYQFFGLEADTPIGYDTVVNRPYGIFQQPNVMATFLATGLVLSAYLLARLPMYRGKWSLHQAGLLLTPVVTIPVLVFVSSRTGWLAAIIATLLILPYLCRFAAKAQWRMWLLMVALGLSLSWHLSTSVSWAPAEDRISLHSARSIHLPQAWEMYRKSPWLGYGYGNFESAYLTQTAQWHHSDPTQPHGLAALEHPHNELLYWAVEGGTLPLLGLLLAAAAVLTRIRKAPPGTRLALVALFFPLTLHTQLEYPFYHALVHWVIFVLLIYWVDNLTAKYYKLKINYVLTIRISMILLPLLISGYMVTTLYSGYWLTKFETSRPPEISYLQRVNNPWAWETRLSWDLAITQLHLGAATQDPDLIQHYVDWATEKAKSWPRPALYQNLIAAYQLLDDPARAAQIRQEAEYLFPADDFSPDALASLFEGAAQPVSQGVTPSLPSTVAQ